MAWLDSKIEFENWVRSYGVFITYSKSKLTHWGRVTHICVSKVNITGSNNGLLPDRRQAIIWTNAGILLIQNLGTNFSEILSEIHTFSFKKMHLRMLSAKGPPFCLSLNVLIPFQLLCFVHHHIILANVIIELSVLDCTLHTVNHPTYISSENDQYKPRQHYPVNCGEASPIALQSYVL